MDNNTAKTSKRPKAKPEQVAKKRAVAKPTTKPKAERKDKERDPSHAAVYFCYVLQGQLPPKKEKASKKKQAQAPLKAADAQSKPKPKPVMRTYVGYTVNPGQRLRQHRGELEGGAKAVRGWKHIKFATIVWSYDREFMDGTAKSLESVIKTGSGLKGRLNKIDKLLAEDPRFASINFYQCTGHDDCMLQLRLMGLDK